jgi:riboflavin synthase
MFSGLVADLGRISVIDRDDEGARLTVETALTPEIGLGDSVAVNGVCLTAPGSNRLHGRGDAPDLDLTSLGEIEAESRVNLELALRADQRLGGHIVRAIRRVAAASNRGFISPVSGSRSPNTSAYVVPQGSVTLEGVSLTVECGPTGSKWP